MTTYEMPNFPWKSADLAITIRAKGIQRTCVERATAKVALARFVEGKAFAVASRRDVFIPVLLAALLCAASIQFATPARARTFTVCPSGCDFVAIAAALQDAGDGDTIAIEDGTYAGGLVVSKDVTLRGSGRDATTILGTPSAAAIRVATGANVAIQAMTITGGGGSSTGSGSRGGGGILNEGGLSLVDSVVRENTVATGVGGGIYSSSSKTLKIRDSVVSGNQAADGGGIFIRRGDVVIEDTNISGNRSTRNGGGINDQGGETLRIERSVISDNRADQDFGGVVSADELVLIDSTVSGNRAANTGGVGGGRELLKVVGSTISGNVSRGSGGGIRVGTGGVSLVDSTVEKNQTQANGAGIFANAFSGDVSLKTSTISGNIAAQDGGGILTEESEIGLDDSQIIDNQAGRQGGGIFSRTAKKGIVKLRNGSTIAGNQPNQCAPVGLRC